MDKFEEVRLNSALSGSLIAKIHNHERILEDRNNGMTYNELMSKYEISSKGTISFIINKSRESKSTGRIPFA